MQKRQRRQRKVKSQKSKVKMNCTRLLPRSRRELTALVRRHGWQKVWLELTLLGVERAANRPEGSKRHWAAVLDTFAAIRAELLRYRTPAERVPLEPRNSKRQ